MKRIILFTITLLIFAAAIASAIKPAIIFFAQKQIGNIFSGSTVVIKGCNIDLSRSITLRDMEIHKPGGYHFKVGEINAEYRLGSIVQGNILKVSLNDATADVNLTQQDILRLSQTTGPRSSGKLSVNTIELSHCSFQVRAPEGRVEAQLALQFNLATSTLTSLDLSIPSLTWQDFTLEQMTAKLAPAQIGDLFIQKIQYGKFKVTGIKAKVRPAAKGLFVDSLSGQILNGTIAGDLSLKIDRYPEYLAKITFANLDLARIVKDFDLKEKVQMSGMVSGKATLTGKGFDINILDGDFLAVDPGGLLEITNNEYLEGLARSTQQPLDIVVASFKDYHYNKGALRFSLEKGDLLFTADLEGETGKRDIKITWHDFALRKE
jgi:hypothetical protein